MMTEMSFLGGREGELSLQEGVLRCFIHNILRITYGYNTSSDHKAIFGVEKEWNVDSQIYSMIEIIWEIHCVRERVKLLKQNKLGNFKFTCHKILSGSLLILYIYLVICTVGDSIERFVQILHDCVLLSLLPLTGYASDLSSEIFIIVCNVSCDTLLQ